MTRRLSVAPAPGPLEEYSALFDPLLGRPNQRGAFRRYLEGLLLPAERNKTLTALANAEPVAGARGPRAQGLRWFLSESTWDPDEVNARRLDLLRADPATAPDAGGVLVIDEHGDRKWGAKTAHVARQYLANLGKIDSGVVSVTSLWADEGVYWPVGYEPYTPAAHFERGKADAAFRTKLAIAGELVGEAVRSGIPFRAVVADCFYGEDRGFKEALGGLAAGYVLALKPSHSWWHAEGTVGALWEAALAASWGGPDRPGDWAKVVRTFRDGRTEEWWALEVDAGPYGPGKAKRAVVATTDPSELPEKRTWYLETNLPAPGSNGARAEGAHPAADLAEVVRLYGLRMWVEQSYKHTKHSLGWSEYQVRSDLAIRRHWALVCCAFSFCWYDRYGGGAPPDAEQVRADAPPPCATDLGAEPNIPASDQVAGSGGDHTPRSATGAVLAPGAASGAGVAGALRGAMALLEGVVGQAPADRAGAAARPPAAG